MGGQLVLDDHSPQLIRRAVREKAGPYAFDGYLRILFPERPLRGVPLADQRLQVSHQLRGSRGQPVPPCDGLHPALLRGVPRVKVTDANEKGSVDIEEHRPWFPGKAAEVGHSRGDGSNALRSSLDHINQLIHLVRAFESHTVSQTAA